MFKDCNPRILGLVVVLTIVSSASVVLCQNQDQRINPRGNQKTPETVVSERDKKTAEQTRIASDFVRFRSPIRISRHKSDSGPYYGIKYGFALGQNLLNEEAREILSEEFSNVGSIVEPSASQPTKSNR